MSHVITVNSRENENAKISVNNISSVTRVSSGAFLDNASYLFNKVVLIRYEYCLTSDWQLIEFSVMFSLLF